MKTILDILKKNGTLLKSWLYEFRHGHSFLLSEEVDIIFETRFDEKYKWMNDTQIQELVRLRIKKMYKNRYPTAKPFRFSRKNHTN